MRRRSDNERGQKMIVKPCIVCRYSEIALKGGNRDLFESALADNIKCCLDANDVAGTVRKIRGRILVYTDDPSAPSHLRRVFGLASISPSSEIDSDAGAITSFVESYVKDRLPPGTRTFRVSTNRADKRFPIASNQMDIDLGALIADTYGLKVSLKQPDFNLQVEIHQRTYVFHEKISCVGGLPVGVSGKVACIVARPQDLVLPWLLMKRGCSVLVLSDVDMDTSLLSYYDYGSPHLFQKKDKDVYSQLLSEGCIMLAVPDTLETFRPEGYKDSEVPVLTPLVGYDDRQIHALYEGIVDV